MVRCRYQIMLVHDWFVCPDSGNQGGGRGGGIYKNI